MRELRLVPGAATAWLAVIAVLLAGRGWAVALIAVVVALCLIARQWGQALFCGAGLAYRGNERRRLRSRHRSHRATRYRTDADQYGRLAAADEGAGVSHPVAGL